MLGQSSFPEKQEYEISTQQSCCPGRTGFSQGLMSFWGVLIWVLPGSLAPSRGQSAAPPGTQPERGQLCVQ